MLLYTRAVPGSKTNPYIWFLFYYASGSKDTFVERATPLLLNLSNAVFAGATDRRSIRGQSVKGKA